MSSTAELTPTPSVPAWPEAVTPAFAPTLYFAATDEREHRVALLLEAVDHARQGDVLHGCSIADAELVVDALARYVELLAVGGVRDYSVDDVRRDCRLALLVWLAGTVGYLTRDANELGERERALQAAAVGDGRLVAPLLDHDAGNVLA